MANNISIYTPKSKGVADKILNEINVFNENNSLKEIDYKITLNNFEFYKNISKEKFDELDIRSKEHKTGNLLFIDYEYFILDGFGYCKVGVR